MVVLKNCINNRFLFLYGLSEVTQLMIRYIYARNKVFMPPIKHLAYGIQSTKMPTRYRTILSELTTLSSTRSLREAYDKLQRITKEIL